MTAFTLLPRFFELIDAARDASDEVDDFDVTDENRDQFQLLTQEQERTSRDLILYVQRNGDELLCQLADLSEIRKDA